MSCTRAVSNEQGTQFEIAEAEAWVDLQTSCPAELREALGLEVHRVADAVALVGRRTSNVAFNRVTGLPFGRPVFREQLDEFIDLYRSAGVERFIVQLCVDGAPISGHATLLQAGFQPRTRIARLLYAQESPISQNVDVTVVRVGRSDAARFGSVMAEAHEDPPAMAGGFAAPVGRSGWSHYLAMLNGEPAGGAAMYTRNGTGWLGFGATRRSARRRHVHTALIAARVRHLRDTGGEWAICDAMEDLPDAPSASFASLRNAGFQLAYFRTNYLYHATDKHRSNGLGM